MRSLMSGVQSPDGAIDVCGTGGDKSGTYNISTAVSFVLAGSGVPVAKHGNRAATSKSGAADVLAALGVNLEADFSQIERAIADANVGFLFAQRHHGAIKHVMPVRKELQIPTVFNLLGPLTNPGGATMQLLGVFAPQWVEPLARVLKELGSERAWVVYGANSDGSGLDEMTTCGETRVAELRDGMINTFIITPEDAGIERAKIEDLRGGEADENAVALRAVLNGEAGPYRDIVVLNAAGALCIAGKAEDIRSGVTMAKEAIDSGAARNALDKLVEISNG
jgi:anthranilate phosphoribosyltransferase